MPRIIMQIEDGKFGLKIVDRAAIGYNDSWQAPAGKTLDDVTIADYESGSTAWSCQIVDGVLTSTPSTETTDVPATWCEPGETIPSPGKSTFELSGSFLQDASSSTGLSAYLFEFDTEEAYAYASWGGDQPPRMIGRVRLASGSIGGPARTNLSSDFTFPLSRKPDLEVGDGTTSRIITGGGELALMSARTAPVAESTTTTKQKATASA